jgi:hypothetical protein
MSSSGVQLMEPTQNKRTLAGGVALGAALALILLTFFHVYYIGRSGDGDLLWNKQEAYLSTIIFPILYFTLPLL